MGREAKAEIARQGDGVRGNVKQGIWRLVDPKITLASAASMFLGACAAAREGPIAWGWLVASVAGIFCLEAAKNASGEIVDFDSGDDQAVAPEDRSPFSGGKRVLVDGMLTKAETAMVAAFGYGLGIVAGLGIAVFREPRILWFGLAGVALAYFYNAPPLKLSHRGVGELAVSITYGPLICCGTYLVQRGEVTSDVLLVSIPLGLLIGAFLWINEFPDLRADESAGKRTLVVRLGRRTASRLFAVLVATAYAWLWLLPPRGLPLSVWFGIAGLPFAVAAGRRLLAHSDVTRQIVPAQGWTLLSIVLFALGVGIGLVTGARGG